MMYRNGILKEDESLLLQEYFQRLQALSRLQTRKRGHEPAWVFASSPEWQHTGATVPTPFSP